MSEQDFSGAPSLRPPVEADAQPLASLRPGAERERPSRHGAVIGRALAEIERLGRAHAPEAPPPCATCAFREGCMTNQMASTVLEAFKCAIGADPSPFGCHHGMRDGEPTRPCGGWLAALAAPFEDVKRISGSMPDELAAQSGPDEVRAAFDAWVATVDPGNALNDYDRGRLYLSSAQAKPSQHDARDGSAPQISEPTA